ncbi:MAG TPA: calcium-binding protein, partial [Burkholderiaceae bacterium]|nr:calcium-binding protein [Burkholderiaceae bacterium]
AHALAKRIDDSGLEKTLESAQDKLDNLDQGLRAVEGAIRHDAGVIKGMVLALDTVDALDPAGDPAATLAAGIEPLVALPNDAVGALNAAYAGIKAEVLALRDAVPEAGFLPVLGVRIAFDRIADSLAFLRGPLEVVGQILKPIEPILDAVGFVFDIFVRPVVDFLLETLGIRHIMDTAAARITGLLPNAGVFDEVLDDFDAAFREIDPLAALDDALGISGWIDQITTGLLDPVGNPQDGPLGIGTTGNDSLTGTAANDLLDAGAGDDTVSGGAGDDILLAGPGQDVLDGGSGQDTAVLRGNLVEYRFSIAGQGGDLVFDHLFPADPRISDGIETTRNIETYTFADLSLTHEQLLNGVRIAAAGQKLLSGTEGVDLLFAAGTAITIDGGSGDDVISGSPQNDTLRGGDGNDLIVRSGGNDAVDGGAGLDTWRYPTDNASGNPHVDADLQRGSVLIGGTTTTLVSIEAVVVQDERTAYLFGSAAGERLTSAAARDLLDGRGGDDLLDGGAGDDVLIGGPGADTLLGGAGSDALAAGESARAGVANFYDGGEGSDTLSYASDLREQVNREHFDTGLRNKARLQEASGPIRVHADSGLIERLSDDGLSVIATDTALGIERYIGSDFDDVLFGASGITVALDGGAGNDLLQGRGPGLLAGGAGDDLLFAAPGSSAQGGGGFDVLDLTAQAGVRWLVRLDGSIGSALRAFNAVDGNQLAVPGGSLQNESGPSVLGSGTVNDIDLYIGSDEDDYVELRSFGHIT